MLRTMVPVLFVLIVLSQSTGFGDDRTAVERLRDLRRQQLQNVPARRGKPFIQEFTNTNRLSLLRKQFIDLATRLAVIASEEQLADEVKRMQEIVEDAEPNTKMNDAISVLQELIAENPDLQSRIVDQLKHQNTKPAENAK